MTFITAETLYIVLYNLMPPRRTTPRHTDGRPKLKVISGLQAAGRFERCDLEVRKSVPNFYYTGMLSAEGAFQIGSFHRLLSRLDFLESEVEAYEPWMALKPDQVVLLAKDLTNLEDERVGELRSVDDPAVHIMDTFRRFQREEHPHFSVDTRMMDRASNAFDIILRSIHDPQVAGLGRLVTSQEASV